MRFASAASPPLENASSQLHITRSWCGKSRADEPGACSVTSNGCTRYPGGGWKSDHYLTALKTWIDFLSISFHQPKLLIFGSSRSCWRACDREGRTELNIYLEHIAVTGASGVVVDQKVPWLEKKTFFGHSFPLFKLLTSWGTCIFGEGEILSFVYIFPKTLVHLSENWTASFPQTAEIWDKQLWMPLESRCPSALRRMVCTNWGPDAMAETTVIQFLCLV